jgi:hypothetical protein
MTLQSTHDRRPGAPPSQNGNGAHTEGGRTIQSAKHRAGEVYNQLGQNMYRMAYDAGMSLSAFLEMEDPSSVEDLREGMDAYSRVIEASGIRVKSLPEWGVYADRFERFDESAQSRALVPEYLCRQWRRAATGQAMHRAVYATPDMPLNTALNPYTDVQRPRQIIGPAIPLTQLVAVTTPIDSDAYRAFYLQTTTPDDARFVRVAETAEIPRAKLVSGEYVVRLHKFGRALEASYEMLRRMTIDRVAFHVQRLAVQAEIDKVAAVLDVIINGDGNANTAAENFNLTTLNPAGTAGTLDLRSWLAFKMKFINPYSLSTILVQEGVGLSLMLLNVGSANIPLVSIAGAAGFGSFTPINPSLRDGVALGWISDAPASKIVGFDQRFAIERVTEIGSNIQEVDRWVTRQTQVLVMSEVEGFAVLDQDAAKILNIAA